MLASVSHAVSSTLAIPKYARLFPFVFVATGVASAFLLGAASLPSLVLDREFVVNPFIEPAGLAFLFVFTLFASLAIVLHARRYDQEKAFGRSAKGALAGLAVSLFTSACPVCPPLLLSLAGVPAALAVLPGNGWPVRFLSLALLALSLHLVSKPLAGEPPTVNTRAESASPGPRTA